MEGILFVIDQLGRNLSAALAENEQLRHQRDQLIEQLARISQPAAPGVSP